MAPRYTDKFRHDAVRMVTTSGLTRPQVPSDSGVGLSTLNKWGLKHQHDDLMSDPHEDVESPPPKSDESWGRVKPLVAARRTASCRNLSVYLGAILNLRNTKHCSKETGTKPGQDQQHSATVLICSQISTTRGTYFACSHARLRNNMKSLPTDDKNSLRSDQWSSSVGGWAPLLNGKHTKRSIKIAYPLRFLHLSWYTTQLSKRGHLARAENYDLVVAVNFLTTLVALLCLEAHGRNWACIQTLQRNRITGDVTVAKLALVYTAQGAVDFRH